MRPPKMYIKLRKKLYLPFKFKRWRKQQEHDLVIRTSKEILDKKEELEERYLTAERIDDTYGVAIIGKQLELIYWLCQSNESIQQIRVGK